MGSTNSKVFKQKPGKKKENDSEDDNTIYFEIVSKEISPHIPPVRVILNEIAIDSLRDSQDFANQLAKSLILDTLMDRKSVTNFSEILKFIFSHESVLKPTRNLVYWSLTLDNTYNNTYGLTKWQVNNWLHNYASDPLANITKNWIVSEPAYYTTIKPLIIPLIKPGDINITPMTNVIVNALPYVKDPATFGIKTFLTNCLKSTETKDAVRDGLLTFLQKIGEKSNKKIP